MVIVRTPFAPTFKILLNIFITFRRNLLNTITNVQNYLLHCINSLKLAENTLHSRINGIKFYYEKVLHQPQLLLDLPRPKKGSKSVTLSEVKSLLENTENLKHNTILKLIYGMGLRVSEIINLKIETY